MVDSADVTGIPTMWSLAQVRVYPYASGARVLTFIVPGRPDKASVQRMLESATGSRVTVQEVSQLPTDYEGPAQDLTHGSDDSQKSVQILRTSRLCEPFQILQV